MSKWGGYFLLGSFFRMHFSAFSSELSSNSFIAAVHVQSFIFSRRESFFQLFQCTLYIVLTTRVNKGTKIVGEKMKDEYQRKLKVLGNERMRDKTINKTSLHFFEHPFRREFYIFSLEFLGNVHKRKEMQTE